MSGLNLLVTGTPRAGTTLTCHLLNQLPNTVALHEPMRLKPFVKETVPERKRQYVRQFLRNQREELLVHGQAISRNVDGKVPQNTVGDRRSDDNLRQSSASRSWITVDKDLTPDFTLILKHHAAFTASLAALVTHFPVYAIVRNPLATLASWCSVDFNVREGRAPAAELAHPELARELAAMPDVLDRQILLIDWFYQQYLKYLPPPSIIRYEDIIATGGRALSVVCAGAASLDEPMQSQNLNVHYDHQGMLRIGERMLQTDGAIWELYPRESVTSLMAELELLLEQGVNERG